MKVKIVTTPEIIATHGGNLLIGELIGQTGLPKRMNILSNGVIATLGGISTVDVVTSYIGVLCQGQSDFEAVEQFRQDPYYAESMGVKYVPLSSTLRQRIDGLGESVKEQTITSIVEENSKLLRKIDVAISPCYQKYVGMDVDVSPFDNSNTKKEGVSYTYKKFEGYAPIFAYIGEEGYCVNVELREGSQHCQKGTPEFLGQAIKNAKIATDSPILVRMDSGNDAVDNIAVMQKAETQAEFIVKRNPRQESIEFHWSYAVDNGVQEEGTRIGKRIYVYESEQKLKGSSEKVRVVSFVTERTSTADGQMLLMPEYELESYYTSLNAQTATATDIQNLYHAHGTSEQFHSEIKTDLDLERLPSGKFNTNAIVLALGITAYNLLRIIGQESLKKNDYPPTAHKVNRRRIRTIIDRYITLAVKFVRRARTAFVKLSEINPWFLSFRRIYFALKL